MINRFTQKLYKKFYLDKENWIDGTSLFIKLIQGRLKPDFKILDIGAGKGKNSTNFKGEVKQVIGLDIDLIIKENPYLDDRIIGDIHSIPFKNSQFDIVIADYVLEHLNHPENALYEISRVLKSNGYFIFRTPNLWHYVTLISKMTPHYIHTNIANWVRSLKTDKSNICSTFYRMNTYKKLKNALSKKGFTEKQLIMIEREPSYMMFSSIFFLLGTIYERIVNSVKFFKFFRASIFGVFLKP